MALPFDGGITIISADAADAIVLALTNRPGGFDRLGRSERCRSGGEIAAAGVEIMCDGISEPLACDGSSAGAGGGRGGGRRVWAGGCGAMDCAGHDAAGINAFLNPRHSGHDQRRAAAAPLVFAAALVWLAILLKPSTPDGLFLPCDVARRRCRCCALIWCWRAIDLGGWSVLASKMFDVMEHLRSYELLALLMTCGRRDLHFCYCVRALSLVIAGDGSTCQVYAGRSI